MDGPHRRASELILDDMATHARKLADLQRAGETVPAVRGLNAAFRELAPALEERNLTRANQIYGTRYEPARIRLQHVLGPANRAAEQRIETAERNLKIGIVFSIFGVVLLIAGLALHVSRVRAREIRAVRKADIELSERDELLQDSERKLQSAERLYRQLVERLAGVTYISSPTTVGPTYVSPQALELLGQPA